MSHRIEQAESLMRKAITQVIQRGLSDPRVRGLVSVTKVDITPDMRQAKVGITVIPEKYEKRTLAGLTAASRHIHGKVKRLVALRTVPHLRFEIDASIKKEAAVLDAINQGLKRSGVEPQDDQATAEDRPSADLFGADGESQNP